MALSDREIRLIYDAGFEAVRAVIQSLEGRIEILEQEVAALKAVMSKNSRNSSKPPSSDGFSKKAPRTQSLRKPSGKKAGGQNGHNPFFLKPVDRPDSIVEHGVDQCRGCGKSLRRKTILRQDKRQIFDLPPLRLDVTEHRADVKLCPCCGLENRGEFPQGLRQAAEYGPRVKGLAVYLMHGHFVPYDRLATFFKEVFHQSISLGSLFNFNRNGYRLLQSSENRIRQDILQAEVAHFDETGVSLSGKGHWLHSASTAGATYYEVHPRRGNEAMDDIGILPKFGGRAMHDYWKSYLRYPCRHGLCNAHHLRELNFLLQTYQETWAGKMKKCLVAMKNSADYYRGKKSHKLPKKLLAYYEGRYDRILREGFALHRNDHAPPTNRRGRKAQAPGKNMLDRLKHDRDSVLAFLRHLNVPFDNNQAERDIRMTKLKQKISGCFRSMEGARFFCRIRGFISTLRKRNLPVLDSLYDVFLNAAPI